MTNKSRNNKNTVKLFHHFNTFLLSKYFHFDYTENKGPKKSNSSENTDFYVKSMYHSNL